MAKDSASGDRSSLALFACPNPDCDSFNRFDAGNLSVVEWTGKAKAIRRLYCSHCHQRFSERKGSLMEQTKLAEGDVVRVIKCLTYGCTTEATADICQVDRRSVDRLADRGGKRSEDFHQLQLDRLAEMDHPPAVVELDELHARVSRPPQSRSAAGKKGEARRGPKSPADRGPGVVRRGVTGFMSRWKSQLGLPW